MPLSSTPHPDAAEPNDNCTENNARICRFLVSKHPQLVRSKGRGGRGLPIHYLASRCNRTLVQEMVLLLLKEYPESVEVKAGRHLPRLSNVPFIQQVAPLLKQESKIQEERDWIVPAVTNFLEYIHSYDHPSLDEAKVGSAFESWTSERDLVLKSLQGSLREQIGEICLAFQGEDVDESGHDSEDGEDEEVWISEDDDSENEEDDESEESSDDEYW